MMADLKIPFMMMGVYYWSIYRPRLLPIWMIFMFGILIDALTMMPIGLTALILLVTQKLILYQRRYLMGQSFAILWIGFGFLYLVSLAVTLGVFKLMGVLEIKFSTLAISTCVAMLTFPFVIIVLHLTHKVLPPPPDVTKSINLQRSRI
jgi:rod shape-determining protein MreD